MNQIPRTFCITLRETPVRTRNFIESSAKANIKAELFYGVLGKKLGIMSKYPNILETSDKNVFITEGAMGCMLSHYILWNVLKYLPEDEFLIVEDDVRFEDNFIEKFQKVYSKLPSNWELVYVGWIPYGNDLTPIAVDDGINIRIPSATHAYLVKKSVLDKLISSIYPFQSPLDLTFIKKILPTVNYYVFDPSLVEQKSYANTSISTWTSLVYDWKNDLYGYKKKLLMDLKFLDGWYNIEKNETEVWRWSKDKFVIQMPVNVVSVELICSTPIDNEVIFTVGNVREKVNVRVGHNQLTIDLLGETKIEGNVVVPFIPSRSDSKSNDSRTLGISLKKMILNMGETCIEVNVNDIFR